MKFKVVNIGALLLGVLITQGTQGYSGAAAISDILAGSDAVVVGYVSTWIETATNVSFDLTVDRVIAGASAISLGSRGPSLGSSGSEDQY